MDTWLVVGLGNPGPRYAGNRHNVGAMVIDELTSRHGGGRLKAHKARASVNETRLGTQTGGAPGPRAVLAVPSCYMNESGGPVKALMQFFGIDSERLVVIHDELDIPAGAVRLKRGGGEGGHNGLRSVSSALGTKDYLRQTSSCATSPSPSARSFRSSSPTPPTPSSSWSPRGSSRRSSGGTVPPSERHFRAFFHAEWVFILVAQNR